MSLSHFHDVVKQNRLNGISRKWMKVMIKFGFSNDEGKHDRFFVDLNTNTMWKQIVKNKCKYRFFSSVVFLSCNQIWWNCREQSMWTSIFALKNVHHLSIRKIFCDQRTNCQRLISNTLTRFNANYVDFIHKKK